MLTNLIIKNYALIEHLEMKPHEALNIITGETGAGKSIMLGAIGLLLGNRADLKSLFNQEEKCIVEATFYIQPYQLQEIFDENELDYNDYTTIRREITPQGKSRAFLNDTPVNLDVLRLIGSFLIDVHSQHDNLMLGDNQFQLRVVDACAGTLAKVQQYVKIFKTYRIFHNQYHQLQKEFQASQNELEYHSFLLEELRKGNFNPDEQEKLEAEVKLLENTEEVKVKLNIAVQALSSSENAITGNLRIVMGALSQIASFSEEYESFRSRAESTLIELNDLNSEIERAEELIEYNPTRLAEAQDRLSLIYRLEQKHQVSSIEELLQIQEDLENKVNKVLNFDDEMVQLKKKMDESLAQVMEEANILSEQRKKSIPMLEENIKGFFADLGMPNAVIKVVQEITEPKADGIDNINFLFSANKGIAPQAIEKVASGGEFSRLMLAVKYILASKTSMPTIIFDEIDTGISGEIALKMGKMMKEMSSKHQIIAISHLHQIAAKGNDHYFVYKDDSAERTISRIRKLNNEDRIYEIAQMISGSKPSESAIISAKELLEL